LALDQFEYEGAHTGRFFEAVDRADVRMIQCRERPRLALETRATLRVARERRRQDFNRDLAFERVVVGAVHLAHATDAEQRTDRIGPEAVADESALRVIQYRL